MNPQDDLQNGVSAETPATSPVENQTPAQEISVQPRGGENPSPEEESWSTLSGPAQERFRAVTREANRLRKEKEELQSLLQQRQSYYAPQQNAYTSPQVTPEVQDAVKKLSEVGIATKAEVDEKLERTISQYFGGMQYQMNLDKLSTKYDGGNGLPAFDKDEYEDYIARHPQYRNYDPEDVYQKMYEPELTEWKISNYKRPAQVTTPSLRPSRTSVSNTEEPLSPEIIEQRLSEMGPAERQTWLAKNQDRVNAILSKTGDNSW